MLEGVLEGVFERVDVNAGRGIIRHYMTQWVINTTPASPTVGR